MRPIKSIESYILSILGCNERMCLILEEIEGNFDVKIQAYDIQEAIYQEKYFTIGEFLQQILFQKIIDKSIAEFPTIDKELITEMFDFRIEGYLYKVYFNNEPVDDWIYLREEIRYWIEDKFK